MRFFSPTSAVQLAYLFFSPLSFFLSVFPGPPSSSLFLFPSSFLPMLKRTAFSSCLSIPPEKLSLCFIFYLACVPFLFYTPIIRAPSSRFCLHIFSCQLSDRSGCAFFFFCNLWNRVYSHWKSIFFLLSYFLSSFIYLFPPIVPSLNELARPFNCDRFYYRRICECRKAARSLKLFTGNFPILFSFIREKKKSLFALSPGAPFPPPPNSPQLFLSFVW